MLMLHCCSSWTWSADYSPGRRDSPACTMPAPTRPTHHSARLRRSSAGASLRHHGLAAKGLARAFVCKAPVPWESHLRLQLYRPPRPGSLQDALAADRTRWPPLCSPLTTPVCRPCSCWHSVC